MKKVNFFLFLCLFAFAFTACNKDNDVLDITDQTEIQQQTPDEIPIDVRKQSTGTNTTYCYRAKAGFDVGCDGTWPYLILDELTFSATACWNRIAEEQALVYAVYGNAACATPAPNACKRMVCLPN